MLKELDATLLGRAHGFGTILVPQRQQWWQSQAAPNPTETPPAEAAKEAPAADGAAPSAQPSATEKPEVDPAAAAAAFTAKVAPSEKATKPEFLPDDQWDAEKGEVKGDALKAAYERIGALTAERKPEDYKIDVSPEVRAELKVPDGESVFDPDAPLTKALPGIFAKLRVDPAEVPGAMSEVAKILRQEEGDLYASLQAEIPKLGENAVPRLNAMRNYIVGNLPEDHANTLLSLLGTSGAGALTAFEALINKGQGLASPGIGGKGGDDLPGAPGSHERLAAIYERNAQQPKRSLRQR